MCETLNKAHVVGVGIRAIHFKSLHGVRSGILPTMDALKPPEHMSFDGGKRCGAMETLGTEHSGHIWWQEN